MNTPPSTTQVLGLIPARGGSKGIPGKNTRPLHGLPLIGYALRSAQSSAILTRTVVSTDCPEIAEVARSLGGETPFLRPADIAEDSTPMVQTIRHAMEWLDGHENYRPDVVALLQPTAPLRTEHHIDEALTRLLSSDADAIVSVTPVPAHYNAQWQVTFDGDRLTLAGEQPISTIVTRRQALSPAYTRNGAIYAFRTEAFHRTGSFYGDTCLGYVMPEHESINIDTPDDWERAERALRSPLDGEPS